MIKFNKNNLVYRTLLTVLVIGLIWLQGWVPSAQASPHHKGTEIAQVLRGSTEPAPKPGASSDRIQAFTQCLPEQLTLNNQDVGNRIARALGEMTNDQVERAFDFTDKPQLSEAESEFESCLQRQGITPARQLVDS